MSHDLYGLPCVSVGRFWRIWWRWGLKSADRELSKWEVKMRTGDYIRAHRLAVLASDMDNGWFIMSWERGPCYRGFILEEGKTRACLRPSINLITCKQLLATGEKKEGKNKAQRHPPQTGRRNRGVMPWTLFSSLVPCTVLSSLVPCTLLSWLIPHSSFLQIGSKDLVSTRVPQCLPVSLSWCLIEIKTSLWRW